MWVNREIMHNYRNVPLVHPEGNVNRIRTKVVFNVRMWTPGGVLYHQWDVSLVYNNMQCMQYKSNSLGIYCSSWVQRLSYKAWKDTKTTSFIAKMRNHIMLLLPSQKKTMIFAPGCMTMRSHLPSLECIEVIPSEELFMPGRKALQEERPSWSKQKEYKARNEMEKKT